MKTLITTLLAGVTLIAPTLAIAVEIEAAEDVALDECVSTDEAAQDATVPEGVELEPTGEPAVDLTAIPVETEPAAYGQLSVTTDPTGRRFRSTASISECPRLPVLRPSRGSIG